ncbi:hypothetical protein [Mycolicibacterium rhodesiae]|uniref:hypothetical protein n=1 Tax=Mycolicibacterium rhodesiae TaxID=36814 RepID=UPI000681D65B|nr:hypothetical protein [Mycolicibacterium rhodesiae]
MPRSGEHVVVCGASMAGLLAAWVLSEFYESVTVVERDVLPARAVQRRGVSQGRHLHMLLTRGLSHPVELFPACSMIWWTTEPCCSTAPIRRRSTSGSAVARWRSMGR